MKKEIVLIAFIACATLAGTWAQNKTSPNETQRDRKQLTVQPDDSLKTIALMFNLNHNGEVTEQGKFTIPHEQLVHVEPYAKDVIGRKYHRYGAITLILDLENHSAKVHLVQNHPRLYGLYDAKIIPAKIKDHEWDLTITLVKKGHAPTRKAFSFDEQINIEPGHRMDVVIDNQHGGPPSLLAPFAASRICRVYFISS